MKIKWESGFCCNSEYTRNYTTFDHVSIVDI